MKSILRFAALLLLAIVLFSCTYVMPVSVYAISGQTVMFESADGNLWVYEYSKDINVNESIYDSVHVLLMCNQFTSSIKDDAILAPLY